MVLLQLLTKKDGGSRAAHIGIFMIRVLQPKASKHDNIYRISLLYYAYFFLCCLYVRIHLIFSFVKVWLLKLLSKGNGDYLHAQNVAAQSPKVMRVLNSNMLRIICCTHIYSLLRTHLIRFVCNMVSKSSCILERLNT